MAILKKNNNKKNGMIIKEIRDPEILFAEVKSYIKDKKIIKEIINAYKYAEEKHSSQKRANGDLYIIHPLTTAYFLAQLQMGPSTIIAGLLHDIIEDTPVTNEELINTFGNEINTLVESVTKVSYFAKENRQQLKSEYLRKLYLSMAQDIRVMIIKVCDRLHNMLTIGNLPEAKQKIIAKETLEIYSTIAHRIGMNTIKSALEDLSFKVLQPEDYQKIVNLVEKDAKERTYEVNKVIGDLTYYLSKEKHIKNLEIFGRSKTIYSIYRKITMLGKSFDEINDILAIRIIANDIDDCYKILGFIHQIYTPISNKFKDYIATPKNNLYQSLHTTLSTKNGVIFEVQIRTEEMDEIAESGAAAHWRYKAGEIEDQNKKQQEIDEKLDIFKRIKDMSDEEEDGSLEKELQEDIFTSSIYVLTPNGKVITLPYGSTILDFAYRIHSEIGEKTIGAKVNGVFVPINTVLTSGEVVEIKTSQNQKPNHNWLKIVVTPNARNRIRKYLSANVINDVNNLNKKEEQKLITDKMKGSVTTYINSRDLRWKKRDDKEIIELIKKDGYQTIEDLYLDIANNKLTVEEAVNKYIVDIEYNKDDEIKDILSKKTESEWTQPNVKNDLIVDGISNIKVEIANCCLPIPFEEVVGYVSTGNGIKVHLPFCPNVNDEKTKKRLISVQWNKQVIENKNYVTKLKFVASERPNLLYEITRVLTSLKAGIISANASLDEKNYTNTGMIKIKIHNSDQLSNIISALKAIPGVHEVDRIIEGDTFNQTKK